MPTSKTTKLTMPQTDAPSGGPLSGHVILCGLGELGFRTLERLRMFGEQVVVVDPEPQPGFVQQLNDWNVPLVQQQIRSHTGLREAGILTARALIAVTDDDMSNLAIILSAREENPDIRLVVRLFNPRLVEKVMSELPHCRVLDVAKLAAPVFAYAGLHDDVLHCLDVPGGRFLLRRVRHRLPPEAQVVTVRRHVDEVFERSGNGIGFTFAKRPEWEHTPDPTQDFAPQDELYALSRAVGEDTWRDEERRRLRDHLRPSQRRFMRELRRKLATVASHPLTPVAGILFVLGSISVELFRESLHLTWQQALYFVMAILTTTGFGDISLKNASVPVMMYGTALMLVGAMLMAVLYASLTDAMLSLRMASVFGRRPVPQRDHFIVAGFGTIGFRIAEELHAMGWPVVAIERQEQSRLVEQGRRLGMSVLLSQDVFGALADLHPEDARGVMTVTDDDALNLELAIAAQEANPDLRAVVRFFDPHMASLVERSFGVNLARSPSAIAAPAFAVAASADDLLDAFDLGDELWCVGCLQIEEGHGLEDGVIARLRREEILVLTHRRANGEWSAQVPPGLRLEAGDQLVIVTPRARWLALHQAAHHRQRRQG